jgi:hypothetical protein
MLWPGNSSDDRVDDRDLRVPKSPALTSDEMGMAIRGWRGGRGWLRPMRARAALADLGDDPNVDDVHRRRLIVYFVEDPDVIGV